MFDDGQRGQRSDQDAQGQIGQAELDALLAALEAEWPALEAWQAQYIAEGQRAQDELLARWEAERPAQEAWLAQYVAEGQAELAALLEGASDTGEDSGAARQR